MIKRTLITLVTLAGLSATFSASAMTSHEFDLYEDYDVASVQMTKTTNHLSVKERIQISSPDDYNVAEVITAKNKHSNSPMHSNSFDNLDDY